MIVSHRPMMTVRGHAILPSNLMIDLPNDLPRSKKNFNFENTFLKLSRNPLLPPIKNLTPFPMKSAISPTNEKIPLPFTNSFPKIFFIPTISFPTISLPKSIKDVIFSPIVLTNPLIAFPILVSPKAALMNDANCWIAPTMLPIKNDPAANSSINGLLPRLPVTSPNVTPLVPLSFFLLFFSLRRASSASSR